MTENKVFAVKNIKVFITLNLGPFKIHRSGKALRRDFCQDTQCSVAPLATQ